MWRSSYYCWFSLLCLSICLVSELLEYLHIERHLAAKFETNLRPWFDRSSSLWIEYLEVVCFPLFLLVSAIFIICRWYSFYKILLSFASAWSSRRVYSAICYVMLKLVWNFNTFDWVLLVGWGLILRCKRVGSICCCCFCLFSLGVDFWSEEIFAKWVPSSGEIRN